MRWLRDKEESVKEARVQEARDLARKEQQRKAELFGAEHVYRTSRVRGPLVSVPPLLATTREEEAAARRAGMDKSEPKKYQFIKEALDALEREHAAKERDAREKAYERNRRRLGMGKGGGAGADDEEEDEAEDDDLRSRIAKMTDEEFKLLALERKRRAEVELGATDEAGAGAAAQGAGRGAGGGRGSGGGGGGRGSRDGGSTCGSTADTSNGHATSRENGHEKGHEKKLWVPDGESASSRPVNSVRRQQRDPKGSSATLDPKKDPDYRR